MSVSEIPLVTVIIPCHNQAHFLGDAIESVLRQTYSRFEIIVVDDGSTDTTSEVALCHPEVRCIKQQNQGLSAARNIGLCNIGLYRSNGSHLVFLDSDDRLLPNALEAGVSCLDCHPGCAFVYGHLKVIASDGSPMASPEQVCVDKDHCLELLRRDYIWTSGVVMYRRNVFESVLGFDTLIDACADCDLNNRMGRDWPVHCHGQVILEYRKHSTNMTKNSTFMLKTAMAACRSQLKYVKGKKQYAEASRRERGTRKNTLVVAYSQKRAPILFRASGVRRCRLC